MVFVILPRDRNEDENEKWVNGYPASSYLVFDCSIVVNSPFYEKMYFFLYKIFFFVARVMRLIAENSTVLTPPPLKPDQG